ncbi:MAG: cell envelope integrity protein TolA [Massilia sp.]
MATISPDTGSPYRVPPEPSRWPSIALAAAVHLGLLAFLFIGINWQNHEPVTVEAEVWDMKTQAAAPPAPPPREIEAPEPEPTPKPLPPPLPPKVVDETPAPKPPDIALEREKRKQEQKKLADAEREKDRREEARREEAREAKLKEEQKKAEQLAARKEQEAAEKKAQALADKKAEEKAAEKKLAEKQKGEKLAKAKAEAADAAKLKALHDAEMKRMLSGVGGTGEAAKSTAPRSDTGYLASIRTKVKGATSYSGDTDVPGNPTAEFRIEQLPSGDIISVKLIKSSGVGSFDDAVEKGIRKAEPLPKKKDGTVERTLVIAFKMKDLN